MGKIFREYSKPNNASSSSTSESSTTSTSITETVNGSHQFKITGYSLSKGLGIGKYIASDTFMVGGYAWAIYFYPDGKSVEDNAAYVSLFIALASEGTDVRALFELTLLDQSGKERHKVHSHFGRTLESGPYTLKYRGSMGYKRFFKRTLLEQSDYLKGDCLSVHCSVGVVKSHTEGPKIYSIAIPPPNIGQHFGQLLESGKRTDVNFEVNGETFAAHKLVLAARSPVFRAQLYGPMKDQNTQCITVEDMEAPVFKQIYIVSNNFVITLCFLVWKEKKLFYELCRPIKSSSIAVMQTDGFEYLKESCPSLLTELLEYVAKVSEHSVVVCRHGNEAILDGSDVNGRRVKQRL
ncbi:hypothetical protein CUMW_054360 [Citrus unshiu]|nr:hypothetical protein CUMW_054360 [Citrus unshiu]